MLAFSNDYYGMIFRATQSVELFCAYPHIAEMTISAVINWEKIKRMEMKERMDKSSLME